MVKALLLLFYAIFITNTIMICNQVLFVPYCTRHFLCNLMHLICPFLHLICPPKKRFPINLLSRKIYNLYFLHNYLHINMCIHNYLKSKQNDYTVNCKKPSKNNLFIKPNSVSFKNCITFNHIIHPSFCNHKKLSPNIFYG